jgi:hypothetical protein
MKLITRMERSYLDMEQPKGDPEGGKSWSVDLTKKTRDIIHLEEEDDKAATVLNDKHNEVKVCHVATLIAGKAPSVFYSTSKED